MVVHGRKKRQARYYSQGFLFIVLVGICLWHTLLRGDGPEMENRLDPDRAVRRLVDPQDHFTLKQRRHGAVILHCIGLFYMFAAIAIVCDECFVPALEVITEVLQISPDVAGATFMAAGGSAPEFFTSLVGAIVTESDIGTGTIIGSAVFNVLFVIGACALVAAEPLKLTWFPLARDSCFYAVDLLFVTYAFLDEKVTWSEALILFILYLIYITFMKYSERIEAWTKGKKTVESDEEEDAEARWAKSRENPDGVPAPDMVVGVAGTGEGGAHKNMQLQRANSSWSSVGHGGAGHANNGDDKTKYFRHKSMRVANHMTAIKNTDNEELHRESGHEDDSTGGSGGTGACVVPEDMHGASPIAEISPSPQPHEKKARQSKASADSELTGVIPRCISSKSSSKSCGSNDVDAENGEKKLDEEDEDENEPLNFNPPELDAGIQAWAYYLGTLPIVVLLVCTVPDVRRDGYRKWFVFTFVTSIMWIAAFTWAMVWFATVIGETCAVEEHIMGLTILAAGTSVPDLLTSVLVAREGHGDMAISSSIGSNIFDVTVGLPVPWLLYGALNNGKAVTIKNQGLEISVMLLLGMLGITIGTIVFHSWVMTKWMGGSLMLLYLVFEVVSVGLTFAPEGSLKLIHM